MSKNDLDPRNEKTTSNSQRLLSREIFFKGKTIITQGDEAFRAYFIEKGRVEVVVDDGGVELKISELGPGDIFGEMALIEDGHRTASVTVLEDCTVTIISRSELENRIKTIDDKAMKALIDLLISRLRQTTKSQLDHYKNLVEFRDRVATIIKRVDSTLEENKRETFRDEITPLLADLQTVLDRYDSEDVQP